MKTNGPDPGHDKRKGPTADSFPVFEELVREVTILFHRLRAAAEEVHQQGQLSGGRRELMRDLDRGGARTVPQIARARSFSRQHAQVLVNSLLEEGYVELQANPSHLKSHLIALTPPGKRFVDAMIRREEALWSAVGAGISERKLRDAVRTVREIRGMFESGDWKALMARRKSSTARRSER